MTEAADARTLLAEGRGAEALDTLGPDGHPALRSTALRLLGRSDEARAVLDRALRTGADAEVLLERALLAFEDGATRAATGFAEAALTTAGARERAWLTMLLSQIAVRAGDLARGDALADEAVELAGGDEALLGAMLRARAQRLSDEDAVAELERATAVFQRTGLPAAAADARVRRAGYLDRLGRRSEAIAECRLALPDLARSPRWLAVARWHLALLLAFDGRDDEAAPLMAEALANRAALPSSVLANALANLAMLAVERGQLEVAAERFREAAAAAAPGSALEISITLHRLPMLAAAGRWDQVDRDAEWATRASVPEQAASALLAVATRAEAASALDRAAWLTSLAHKGLQGRRTATAEQAEDGLRRLRRAGACVPLGPFDLVAPIGRGGLGCVWRARHRATGLWAAVKTIGGRGGLRGAEDASLLRELAAVASLHHPHVLALLDHGVVDAAAAAAEPELALGAPWLATDLLASDLRAWIGRMDWPVVRATLLALLDALAHVHARGLLHLDIKPANVLVGADGPPDVRLADLGLAHAVLTDSDPLRGGTPSYMAPEQLRGRSRELGWPTDLYALGCLAWAVVAGQPPFGSGSPEQVRLAQLHAPLPPLQSAIAVPGGLEPWLLRMLDKDIGSRFLDAPSAAAGLRQLGDPTVVAQTEAPQMSSVADTFAGDLDLPADGNAGPPQTEAADVLPTPMPKTWQLNGRGALPASAGVGLVGRRVPPPFGRQQECGALWDDVLAVASGRDARLVELVGGAGSNAEGLALALLVRVVEVGAAHALLVREPHGLVDAARRLHRAAGLDGPSLRALLMRRLPLHGCRDPHLVEPIAAWLEGASADGSPFLAALASGRPIVAVVDPVPSTLEAVLVPGLPILVVVLSSPDLSVVRPEAAAALAARRPRRVELGRVDDDDVARMIDVVVPLDPRTRDRLLRRARGRPGTALDIVGGWAGRGRLRRAPSTGFEVTRAPAPTRDPLPVADGEDLRVLEVAAALGDEVDPSAWRAAAVASGATEAGRVDACIAGLERQGHARRADVAGPALVLAPALRWALLASARDHGRHVAVHAAAAAVAGDDAAAGRALLEAGAYVDAAARLLVAARAAALARPLACVELLDDWSRALDAAGVGPAHPDRAPGVMLRANAALSTGEHAAAVAIGRAGAGLVTGAELVGLRRLTARALARGGDREAGLVELQGAVEVARTVGDRDLLGSVLAAHAGALRELDRLDEAAVVAAEAASHGASASAAFEAFDLGRFVEARRLLEAAVAGASDRPDRAGALLLTLSDAARFTGDLAAAEDASRRAAALRAADVDVAMAVDMNLALVAFGRGDDEALSFHLARAQAGRVRWPALAETVVLLERARAAADRGAAHVEALVRDLPTERDARMELRWLLGVVAARRAEAGDDVGSALALARMDSLER